MFSMAARDLARIRIQMNAKNTNEQLVSVIEGIGEKRARAHREDVLLKRVVL